MKKTNRLILGAVVLGLCFQAACMVIYFSVRGEADRYLTDDIRTVPSVYTGVVLGAAVYADGRISDVLYDRLEKAYGLYRAGKVKRLLLSGDHGTVAYDEVNHMRDFMVSRGVPRENLFLDHAGFNTYDSLVRARRVFRAGDCIIVTQRFHLPRALYIARRAGLRAWGYPADRRRYLYRKRYAVREYFAVMKAFLDCAIRRDPRFTGKPIPITGSSSPSWD